MELYDLIVLLFIFVFISAYGLLKSSEAAKNTKEVLIGSGMSVWSVALSVCSGFISSISLLGFTAEVYYFGTMMVWYMPMYILAFPIVAYLFLPVFYELKLHTIYEYLELRFNFPVRVFATCLFCMQMLLYNSVALYAPSLAIASLTGISLNTSIVLTALISAVYISVGGAKAGVHTSAIQMTVIFISMISIIVVGWSNTNFNSIFEAAWNGSRIQVSDFRVDPRIRHSTWSLMIGGTGNILALFAANQLSVQRYLAMPTLKKAQRVVLLNIVCNIFILSSYLFVGLLIYYFFKDCDPGLKSANELLPHFVKTIFHGLSGLTGLFAAAVYSAGISTMSASFTALTTVLVQDVISLSQQKRNKKPLSEECLMLLTRITPFVLAVIATGLAMACDQLSTIVLEIAFIVFGAVGGPVLGSFINGFFIPWIKGKAAFVGLCASTIICFAVSFGAASMKVKPYRLPLAAECRNETSLALDPMLIGMVSPYQEDGDLSVQLFRLSYQYYSILGALSNVLVAAVIQRLLDGLGLSSSEKVEQRLLSPFLRKKTQPINQDEVISLTQQA